MSVSRQILAIYVLAFVLHLVNQSRAADALPPSAPQVEEETVPCAECRTVVVRGISKIEVQTVLCGECYAILYRKLAELTSDYNRVETDRDCLEMELEACRER